MGMSEPYVPPGSCIWCPKCCRKLTCAETWGEDGWLRQDCKTCCTGTITANEHLVDAVSSGAREEGQRQAAEAMVRWHRFEALKWNGKQNDRARAHHEIGKGVERGDWRAYLPDGSEE